MTSVAFVRPKAQLWRVHLPSSAVMPYHDSWNGSWAWRWNSDSDEIEALKAQAATHDEKLDFLLGRIAELTAMVNELKSEVQALKEREPA